MLFSNGLGSHLSSLLDKMGEASDKDKGKLQVSVDELRQRLAEVRRPLAAKPAPQKNEG